MITIKCEIFNICQKNYDDIINSINISELICPSCNHADMVIHGHYKRKIKTSSGTITIIIKRVKCKTCGKTHAILLSFFVPYSLISFNHHLRIINNDDIEELMDEVVDIDESDIGNIKRRYKKYWKEKLISFDISITDTDLIDKCFKWFDRQFMQNKCTVNCLFNLNHIS